MKKIFLLAITLALFAACGGTTEKPKTEETITPELKEVSKKTDDLKIQSEKINNKADSILKNI